MERPGRDRAQGSPRELTADPAARDADAARPDPSRADRTALLAFAAACLTVATLRPFRAVLDPAELAWRAGAALRAWRVVDPLPQVAGLVAYGLLVGAALPPARRWARRAAGPVWIVALELAQLLVEGRHARAADLVTNLACVTLGCALADGLRRAYTSRGGRGPRLGRPAWAAAAIAAIGASVAGSAYARAGLAATWHADAPLSVGDEACGERAWHGAWSGLALYASCPDAERLPALPFDRVDERAALGALHLWTLDGGDPLPDRIGDLDLHHAGERWSSNDPPRELARHVAATGTFAIELHATPPPVPPATQARIVTASHDWYRRDFALLQERDALLLRVRTPANGPNGAAREGRWPHVWADGRAHHFLVTWDRGRMRLFRDGALVPPEQHLYDGAEHASIARLRALGASGAAQGLALAVFAFAASRARGRRAPGIPTWVGLLVALSLWIPVAPSPGTVVLGVVLALAGAVAPLHFRA